MKADPAIDVTRRAREDICGALDHEPAKVIAYYMKMQRRFADRLRPGPTEEEARADRAAREQADRRDG